MCSKSIIAIEVEVCGDEVVLKSLGTGACDFFGDTPWPVSAGTLLRCVRV